MEKVYIGTAKAIETKYGEVITLSFSPKDLESLKNNVNEKGWINLNISERKEIGKYGETHSVTVNNWKPEKDRKIERKEISIEDVPF